MRVNVRLYVPTHVDVHGTQEHWDHRVARMERRAVPPELARRVVNLRQHLGCVLANFVRQRMAAAVDQASS